MLTPDQRRRFLAAAERGLAWRRDRIMLARLAVTVMVESFGWPVDWHSLFTCERHGHRPLDAKWVGPYDLEAAIVDTAQRGGLT